MTAGVLGRAPGDAHNADASATASTLNHALGRKHIKSWMNGATNQTPTLPPFPHRPSSTTPHLAPPVALKKRDRPRKYPLPEAVNQQHAIRASSVNNRTATAPPAEKLPPSNSTSPQLANIVTNHPQIPSHGNLDVGVFPSPTPSEEDTHQSGLHIQGLGKGQSVNIDQLNFASMQSPKAPIPGPASTTRSYAGEHLHLQKRSVVELSEPTKRARIDTAQSPSRPPTTMSPVELLTFPEFTQRPSAPHTQIRSPLLSQAPSYSPPFSRISNRQLASPQLAQASRPPGGLPSSRANPSPVLNQVQQHAPARDEFAYPQLIAQSPGMLSATQPYPQHPYVAPSQRRLSQKDDWYTIDDCAYELSSLATRYPPMLRSAADTVRLQVLEEAVMANDWAYLILHQYYCIMTYSPQDLPLSLQRNGNLTVAHSLLHEVLDDNKQLSTVVLAFFATFPYAVDVLALRWSTRYQELEHGFVAFVNMSAHVGALRQACERRGVPPTPREFANCAVTSVIFRRLLFRSILRVLWARCPPIIEKGQFEDQALRYLDRAQAMFEHLRAAGGVGGREQTDLELRSWQSNFFQIANSLDATLQTQGFQHLGLASPRLNQQQQQQLIQQQQHQLIQQQQHQLVQQRQQQLTQQQSHPRVQSQQQSYPANSSANARVSSRTHPAPPAPPRTYLPPASQAHPSSRPRHGRTPLLPPSGVLQSQQRVPVPSRFGLHQAHLRSPVLRAPNLSSPSYLFWQGFILKPRRLKNANTAIEKLSFTFGAKDMEVVAKAMPMPPGAPDIRLIDEDHRLIRLRSVKWPAHSMPSDEEWAVADNSWVPYSSFSLNDRPLETRKKLHHGRDLPVDITSLVSRGENILEISVMSNSDDHVYRKYLIAVEFLGVMTRQSIEKRCREETVPAQAVIGDIKRKLSASATDDGEIILMESTLTINLRDPFSASKICDTPVRGKACLHNECFDLDTFLETRPRKGDATAADQWRCPICKADARPSSLVVDGFLVEVRKELERKGLLDTRAIVVSQDGSWKPKPEERDTDGLADRDTPEPTPAAVRVATRSKSKSAVVHEIIDLSD